MASNPFMSGGLHVRELCIVGFPVLTIPMEPPAVDAPKDRGQFDAARQTWAVTRKWTNGA